MKQYADAKKRVLITVAGFYPGYKAGGPVRTAENIIRSMSDEYDFYVVTTDRDIGEKVRFEGVKANVWCDVMNAHIFYASDAVSAAIEINKIAKKIDVIYACGGFSSFSLSILIMKRLNLLPAHVVVAPMGIFARGALGIKAKKKKVFLEIFKRLHLYDGALWSATSQIESDDIRRIIGRNAVCMITQDFPQEADGLTWRKKQKHPKQLNVIYLSRISPEKNLKVAIETIKGMHSTVVFDIYGTIEDEKYWNECKEVLKGLPSNATYQYHGSIRPADVIQAFAKSHVFLFPTLGENYSHAIHEALLGGCLVVTSDQTPWGNMQSEGVGHCIRLQDKYKFVHVMEQYAHMDENEYQIISKRAYEYGKEHSNVRRALESYRRIFNGEVSV